MTLPYIGTVVNGTINYNLNSGKGNLDVMDADKKLKTKLFVRQTMSLSGEHVLFDYLLSKEVPRIVANAYCIPVRKMLLFMKTNVCPRRT